MNKKLRKLSFLKYFSIKAKVVFGFVAFLVIATFLFGSYSDVLSGKLEFYSVTDYPVGAEPWYLISADLNNDGNLDLVTANLTDNNVSVIFGNSDGTFGVKTDYLTAGGASGNVWVEAAYLNTDSYLDLVTANSSTNNVSVLLNNGNGTFSSSIEYPANIGTSSVYARDFNQDNYLDLVVSNLTSNNVSILLGAGDGTFGVKTDYPTGLGPWLTFPEDLNNNGNLDIITVNEFNSTISVLFGNGNGTFQAKNDYFAGASSWAVKLADFNQDNILDAITTNVGDNTFSVLLGDGLGGFLAPSFYPTGITPWYPSVADLDLDGYLDVVILNFGSDNISIYRGKGDGTFENPIIYATNVEPADIEAADFNKDGIIDFAVASQKGGVNSTVTVFLNKIFNTYCSLSPSSLTSGAQVTINATTTFTATSVWAEVENNNNLLTTVYLDNIGGNDYSKSITTSNVNLGDNDVAIYASNGTDISVCSPSTGVNWQKKTVNDIPWHSRSGLRSVSYNNRIYIAGGTVDDFSNEVWSSVDGNTWRQDASNAPWTKRSHGGFIVFNNKMWLLGGNNYVDASDTSTFTYFKDIWTSTNGSDWVSENNNAPWGERVFFGLTEFNNSLWLSGGVEKVGLTFNRQDDIWTSTDGINWTCVVGTDPGCGGAPAWSNRFGHKMVTYDNKMWIIGGYGVGAYNYLSDVWSSVDGVNWVCESGAAPGCASGTPGWGTPNPGENGRQYHEVLIFDEDGAGPLPEKMWLMGGRFKLDAATPEVDYNDVWSSTDGQNWTLEIDPGFKHQPVGVEPNNWTHWTARRNFAAVTHDAGIGDEMWVLGGYEFRVKSWNDVWHSSNGINWNIIGSNSDLNMGTRFDPQMFEFNDKLWVVGGLANGLGEQDDVWSSVDGTNWICEAGAHSGCSTTTPWSGRWGHQVFVFNNKMWLVGGCTGDYSAWCQNGVRSRDVWSSSDGVNWIQATAAANYTWSNWPTANILNNKMWLIGGWVPGIGYDNQVWSSSDGITWTQSADGPWTGRTAPESVVYDDGTGEKLYFMGGVIAPTTRFNDVWSFDGTTWLQETPVAAWSTRYAFGLVNYNDKMWLFGGNVADYYLPALWSDDVWWSTDGATWTVATLDAEFDGRDFFEATVFKNKIWLGFGDSNGGSNNDVWASKLDTMLFSVNPQTGTAIVTPLPLLDEPDEFMCEAQTNDEIKWLFTDMSDNETGFKLIEPGEVNNIEIYNIEEINLSEITESELDTNIQYTRFVSVYNADVQADTESISCYTLANIPVVPIILEQNDSSLVLGLDLADDNPENTEYAIFEINNEQYIQIDGTFGETETWLTYESWGGENGVEIFGYEITVTALDPGAEYVFVVKARNGDDIETGFSESSSAELPLELVDNVIIENPIKGVGINISQPVTYGISKTVLATKFLGSSNKIKIIQEVSILINLILIILILLFLYSLSGVVRHISNKDHAFKEKLKLYWHTIFKKPVHFFTQNARQDERGVYNLSYSKHKDLHCASKSHSKGLLAMLLLKILVITLLIVGINELKHFGIAQEAPYNQDQLEVNETDELSYVIEFFNEGEDTALDVFVLDEINTNLSIVEGSGYIRVAGEARERPVLFENNIFIFDVGDVGSQKIAYVGFKAIVAEGTAGEIITNQGVITGSNFNSVITNTTSNLILVPEPFCGDGNIDINETCDIGADPMGCEENEECVDCQCQQIVYPSCGDGNIDSNELCDPQAVPTGCQVNYQCIDCSCIYVADSYCGDGNIDLNESCDPQAVPTGCSDNESCINCTCQTTDEPEIPIEPIEPAEPPVTPPPPPIQPPSQPIEPGEPSIIDSIMKNVVVTFLVENILDNPQIEQKSQSVITPLLIALAAVNTIPTAITLTSYLLYYLHLIFSEPFLFFFRRKRKKWGVVYDSLSKMPISLAVVRLYSKETRKLVQTKVTDKEGRYLMIVKNSGKYFLSVIKPGYVFPTELLISEQQDAKYLDLYHGEEVDVSENGIILTANIPLDKLDQKHLPVKEVIKGYLIRNIRLMISYIGLILSVLVFVIYPTIITGVAIGLHILLFVIFRKLIVPKKSKNWGIVYDEKTKRPLKQVVVRIFDNRFNKLLETQVTDRKGRYSFLVGENEYQLLTEKQGYDRKTIKPVDLINKERIVNLDIGLEQL